LGRKRKLAKKAKQRKDKISFGLLASSLAIFQKIKKEKREGASQTILKSKKAKQKRKTKKETQRQLFSFQKKKNKEKEPERKKPAGLRIQRFAESKKQQKRRNSRNS